MGALKRSQDASLIAITSLIYFSHESLWLCGGALNCTLNPSFTGLLLYRTNVLHHALISNPSLKLKPIYGLITPSLAIQRAQPPPFCTYLVGVRDVANREVTNLPPRRQIIGSRTVGCCSSGGNKWCVIKLWDPQLHTHTPLNTHPGETRDSQSIVATRAPYRQLAPLWLDLSSGWVGEGCCSNALKGFTRTKKEISTFVTVCLLIVALK